MMKCPGCSKHCCENAPRCRYGRAYFVKMNEKTVNSPKYKWEKHLTPNGLIWQMLMTNRKMKKAICKDRVSENALMAVLTHEEQQAITVALAKLEAVIPAEK